MTNKSIADPKKIALVYDAIYPYIKGGGEKRFYELGRALCRQGFDVHLYGMKLWKGPKVIKKNGLTLHGITKARPLYTKSGKRNILQAIIFGLSCIKLIREDFDAIDCCGFPYFSLFSCKLVCLLKRKKLSATWHEVWGKEYWQEYLGPLGFVGSAIEQLASHMPDEFIAVSQHTAVAIKAVYKTKIPVVVIPNGIDSKKINAIAPSLNTCDLIYTGRLLKHKNVDKIIRSVSIVRRSLPEISLTIIGDGPEKHSLMKLADKLGITGNIQFLGFVQKHEEVLSTMKASKLFVLPSEREGFGMVAIEANACGIPVLTSNHKNNATQELITDITGRVSSVKPDVFSLAIIEMLSSPFRPIDCKAYAASFDWHTISAQFSKALL